MSTRAFTFVGIVLGACAIGGCGQDSSQPPAQGEEDDTESRPNEGEAIALELPRFPRRLTSSDTAISNFNGQIDSLEAALERDPGSLIHAPQLVSAWLSRTQFLGTYEDFGRADAVTSELLAVAPDDAATHTLRANFLSSVHRFDEAEVAIERATELGDASAASKTTTYDLARGRNLEHVLERRTEALGDVSTFAELTDVAAAEAALGQFEHADAHYTEALSVYRDVSPLPIAWVYFQRGVMWGEMANEPAAARILYEEAVRLLPDYVAANVHLAEREYADGDEEVAIAHLTRIASSTSDPEPKSRLSQYLSKSDPIRAAVLRREAHDGYSALLREYPQAFLDHASEFFANAGGDPDRALELALENLRSRKNARAYIVALQAAAAADNGERWCELALEAASSASMNRNLKEIIDTPAFECVE